MLKKDLLVLPDGTRESANNFLTAMGVGRLVPESEVPGELRQLSLGGEFAAVPAGGGGDDGQGEVTVYESTVSRSLTASELVDARERDQGVSFFVGLARQGPGERREIRVRRRYGNEELRRVHDKGRI